MPRQVIRGLGVEIQSDSIGSDNDGLPDKNVSVPHDLTATERQRLAEELIGRGHGFRYIRLAGGLYYRGLTPDRKNLRERWPEQLQELSALIKQSGAQGVAFEYWSPPTYWKTNDTYLGGKLKSFEAPFLQDFAEAVAGDIRYLLHNDIPVLKFSLQNEPPLNVTKYSHAKYSDAEYVKTFNIVARRIRSEFPAIEIQANSWDGPERAVLREGLDLSLVDSWVWHRVGRDSDDQLENACRFTANRMGKPAYSNEFEYLANDTSYPNRAKRHINTAQSLMNWMTFVDSPTWYWLHALKPTYNVEAEDFALGYWRPADDRDYTRHPGIKPGHFDYEPRNWRALSGFLDWMPWDSQRYHVDEEEVVKDARILAFRQGGADGKLVIALTNRRNKPYTFTIDTGTKSRFRGYRYSLADEKAPQPVSAGGTLEVVVPALAIEFWVEQ